MSSWMIYGATGYTGTLLAREAKNRGLEPVLAARSEAKLAPLAEGLGLAWRCFALDETTAEHLQDITVVLHCAGPFSATSAPMVEACLASRTHYLDITGEIDVFEQVHNQGPRAEAAGVVLCSGVGFDVIPTDCLAAALKEALPQATDLALGFDSRSGYSPGTAKTAVEGLGQGGRVRRDGKITAVPLAYRVRRIDFGAGEKTAVTIPWGDVASAYYTTGIPNIEVYIPASPKLIRWQRRLDKARPLLAAGWVRRLLQSWIQARVSGPDAAQRSDTPTRVWGEASDGAGRIKTAYLNTANGYDVTVHGALAVVAKLLQESPAGGAYTPAKLMGKDFVTTLPGSSEITLL